MRLTVIAALSSALIFQPVFASIQSSDGADSSNIYGIDKTDQGTALELDQWFEVSKTAIIQIIKSNSAEDQSEAAQDGQFATLPEGLQFNVLERAVDPQLGTLVRIGIDVGGDDNDVDSDEGDETADGATLLPSDIWVKEAELQRAKPKAFDNEAMISLEEYANANFDPNNPEGPFEQWFDSTMEAKNKKGGARKKKGGMTYCYREVKQKAMALGYCRHYPSGAEARLGYSIMLRECNYHPASYSSSLPIGSVCFSSGKRSCGKHKCGHVAIKIGGSTWKGAGIRAVPWVGAAGNCIAPGGGGKASTKTSNTKASSKKSTKKANSKNKSSKKGSKKNGKKSGQKRKGKRK